MTEADKPVFVRGLEGVIAAETRIGMVDGVNGKLYYAGYDVDDLAGKVCFEEVVHLLYYDKLPTKSQLRKLRGKLVSQMTLPKPLVQWFKRVPKKIHPMVVLRSAVSDLALYDPEPGDNSSEANHRRGLMLVAMVPTIIAGMYRLHNKREIIKPDHKKGIAENFLRIFLGREITKDEAKAIELMFVLHADHGFNASTFSARVTASTMADMYAAITSAIGTLQGPLHGGANQRVMEMLTEIGSPDMADEYIDGLLARKERVMGFGHRVYKVEDPRAKHLRKYVAKLCEADKECLFYEMSELIEKKVKKDKGIYPNVDFYSATVQHHLGIPVEYYTTLFAASRIAGWTAHVIEQLADNRLMRPKSRFVGKHPRKFTAMSKREAP